MKKIKVLFICKKRINQYGVTLGLLNSANFTSNALNKVGIESKVTTVIDGNGIDKEVHNYGATHVVLEAIWVTPTKITELANLPKYKDVKWYVNLHSKIPFLAMEGIAIDWIGKYIKLGLKNVFIACNSEETISDLTNSIPGSNFVYLPNVYCPEDKLEEPQEIRNQRSKNTLNIGCFGAIRPLKNHLIQAVSAVIYANKNKKNLNFHINANRVEQNGDNILKNMRNLFDLNCNHVLVEHTWLTHRDFIALIQQMDLGMQVSYSETFNIIAADFVANNVPVVVSPEISWMNGWFKADPNSTDSIVSTMKRVVTASKIGLHRVNKLYLDIFNEKSLNEWKKELTG